MSPSPSDVGKTDLYGTFGSSANAVSELTGNVVEGLREPDEAEGWIGILIPAIVTGLAIAFARRLIL